jgi:hypothetical protein
MTLCITRRYLSDRSLVDLPDTANALLLLLLSRAFFPGVTKSTLLQPSKVEPNVVVSTVMCQLFFVLDSALAKDGGLERCSRAVLLLELRVRSIEGCGF